MHFTYHYVNLQLNKDKILFSLRINVFTLFLDGSDFFTLIHSEERPFFESLPSTPKPVPKNVFPSNTRIPYF